jgi:hypothetical protein
VVAYFQYFLHGGDWKIAATGRQECLPYFV